MQKTGKLICTHCMKETNEFCYYKPFLNIFFEVVKNKFGHYMLTVSENSDVKLTMIGKPDMKRGLPLKFRVRYRKDGRNGEFTALPSQRICPHCYRERKEIQYLSPYTGYYPTYTIAIVGMPSVGKSGWSNSCISEKAKKDAAIRFRKGCVESERLVANQMPERNKLIKELILIDEKGKDKALTYLDAWNQFVSYASSTGSYENAYNSLRSWLQGQGVGSTDTNGVIQFIRDCMIDANTRQYQQ